LFFSEEKNQKTFNSARVSSYRDLAGIGALFGSEMVG
jgi:hypothetical protein